MDKRYCVKFTRCDGAAPAVEEYYYWDKEDAEIICPCLVMMIQILRKCMIGFN